MTARRIGSLPGSLWAAARWQRWDRERTQEFQSRRLRLVVRHAYENVPFYRRRLDDAGLRPEDVRGIEDLARLPTTSREELQATPIADRLARGVNPARLLMWRTSGSTGRPLTILRAAAERRLNAGITLGVMRRYGLRLTDLQVGLYHVRAGEAWPTTFFAGLGVLRHVSVSALAPAEEILAHLRQLAPDALGGYAGSLAWLTRFMIDEDRRTIRPRLLTCGAEVLTAPMRRQMTAAFGVPPHDLYASHELGLIGWQCPDGELLHVCGVESLIEVLRDGAPARPGEEGELVGTPLHSFAMPFIRYRQGDQVKVGPSPCVCGADVVTLEAVHGRVADRFVLPGGREMHPYVLAHALNRAAPWLGRFQIVQTEPGTLLARVEPLPGAVPGPAEIETLVARIEERTGGGVRVVVEVVDEIRPGETGKFRTYVPFGS